VRVTLSPRAKKLAAPPGWSGCWSGWSPAVLAFVRPRGLEGIELWTYDQRAKVVARQGAASSDIVLIEVSEQDIEDAEDNLDVTWPWPRAMYGYIAAYCKAAGAKVVVFDWLFQDRGQYSVGDAEEFAQAMRDAGNVVIGLALTRDPLVARPRSGAWAAPLATFPTVAAAEVAAQKLLAWNTRVFVIPDGAGATVWYGGKDHAEDVVAAWRRMSSAEELSELFAPPSDAPPTDAPPSDAPPSDAPPSDALPSDAPPSDAPAEPPPPVEPTPRQLTAAELASELTATTIITRRDGVVGGDGGMRLERKDGLDPPLAVIAAGPARSGNVYQGTDADGIMRQHAPLVRHGDRLYPSLALAAYLVAHPGVAPSLRDGRLVLTDAAGGKAPVVIPLDEHGRFSLRFHRAGAYPRDLGVRGAALAGAARRGPGAGHRVRAAARQVRDRRGHRPGPARRAHHAARHAGPRLGDPGHRDRQPRGGERDPAREPRRRRGGGAGAVHAGRAGRHRGVDGHPQDHDRAGGDHRDQPAASLLGYWWLARWLFIHDGLWIGVAIPATGAVASVFAIILVTSAAERRNRRFVQEALGRYTSAALVKELMEHPEHLSLEWGERRGMSVYFSDIAGVHQLQREHAARGSGAAAQRLPDHMTDLVLEHGGVVDKYIGDAVMAFWGAPIPNADHARRRCAARSRCATAAPSYARAGRSATASTSSPAPACRRATPSSATWAPSTSTTTP
jgi:hypothetical protein